MAQQAATPPPAAGPGPRLDAAVHPAVAPARAYERRGPARQTYGAIDLGTNNCRLLIARPSDGGFTVVDAFSRIVRLGEGMGVSGRRTAPERIHPSFRPTSPARFNRDATARKAA